MQISIFVSISFPPLGSDFVVSMILEKEAKASNLDNNFFFFAF